MLTIRKVFTLLSTLPGGNREYPGCFQNELYLKFKKVNSFYK